MHKIKKQNYKSLCRSALFTMILLLMPYDAIALSTGGIGGYPAHPDPNIKYSESWFIYSLDLGESKEDAISVFNNTDEEVSLKLYAVDSIPSNQGNFALEKEDEPRDGIGAWIKLSEEYLTLQPHESREIPFVITIPANADVGEHAGGIILQKAQKGVIETPMGASMVTRIGIRVYETVPGGIVKDVELVDFNIERKISDSKKPYYEITLVARNKGNISLTSLASIEITGWGKTQYFTRSKFKDGIVIDFTDFVDFFKGEKLEKEWQLLRGQKVITRWEWPAPVFGRYNIQATLRYDGTDGPQTVKSRIITVSVYPTKLIISILAILLLIVLLIILRKFGLGRKKWVKYVVKKEDQLVDLAEAYGVNWKKLAKANKLKKPILKEGQVIIVPSKKKKKGDSK